MIDLRVSDSCRLAELEFRRWCAENLVDQRLEELLSEAFGAGWLAREGVQALSHTPGGTGTPKPEKAA